MIEYLTSKDRPDNDFVAEMVFAIAGDPNERGFQFYQPNP